MGVGNQPSWDETTEVENNSPSWDETAPVSDSKKSADNDIPTIDPPQTEAEKNLVSETLIKPSFLPFGLSAKSRKSDEGKNEKKGVLNALSALSNIPGTPYHEIKDAADIATSPVKALVHGVGSGIKEIATHSTFGMPANPTQLLQTAHGLATAAFGMLNVLPPVAAFTMGTELAGKVVPEKYINYVFAPISSLAEKFSPELLESDAGKAGLGLADIGVTLLGFHKLGLLGDKIKNGKELSVDEVNQAAESIGKSTPEEIAQAAKEVVVDNTHPDLAPIKEKEIALTQDLNNALPIMGEDAQKLFAPEIEKTQVELAAKEKQIETVSKLEEALPLARSEEGKKLILDQLNKLNPKKVDASKIESTKSVGEQPIGEESTRSGGGEGVEQGNEGKETAGAGEEKEIIPPTETAESNVSEIKSEANGKKEKEVSDETQTGENEVLISEPLVKAGGEEPPVVSSRAEVKESVKSAEEKTAINEANKIAKENDFSNATHLLNSVNKRTGKKYNTVQEIPDEVIKKVKSDRSKPSLAEIKSKVIEKAPEAKASAKKEGVSLKVQKDDLLSQIQRAKLAVVDVLEVEKFSPDFQNEIKKVLEKEGFETSTHETSGTTQVVFDVEGDGQFRLAADGLEEAYKEVEKHWKVSEQKPIAKDIRRAPLPKQVPMGDYSSLAKAEESKNSALENLETAKKSGNKEQENLYQKQAELESDEYKYSLDKHETNIATVKRIESDIAENKFNDLYEVDRLLRLPELKNEVAKFEGEKLPNEKPNYTLAKESLEKILDKKTAEHEKFSEKFKKQDGTFKKNISKSDQSRLDREVSEIADLKTKLAEVRSKEKSALVEEKIDKQNELKEKQKAKIASGVNGVVNKFGVKKNLTPEEQTKLFDDLKNIVEGSIGLGGITLKEAIAHVIQSVKETKWYQDFSKEDKVHAEEVVEKVAKSFEREEIKGITKEELKKEWDRIGIDEDFKDGLKQDFGKLADEAKSKIETGRVNADELAQEYADNINKPVSDENLALLLTRKRQLQNQIDDIAQEPDTPENRITAAAIQDRYETLLRGVNNATTTSGRALRSVQMALEKDFSLATMKAQIKNIKGEPLTEAEIAHIESLHKEIQELRKKNEEYEKKISELGSENEALRDLIKDSEKEKKRSPRTATKEYLKKDRENLYVQLYRIAKKQRAKLSANPIPVEMIPVLTKLAKNYIKDGIVSAEEIASNIHDKLRGAITGLTVDHIKESLFKKKQKPVLDRERLALKAAEKKAQDKFNLLKREYEKKNRGKGERVRDALLKWQRFAILSGVKTLGKLTAAATARQFLTSTIEEGIGWGIGKAVPKVAKDAPREGGYNAKAEAKNITEAFKKATYKDIWETAKAGKGELDQLFGRSSLPPEALDFFGQLHSALKTMPKRGEFFRSFEKRMEHAIRNGADASDPLVQAEIGAKAYEDAQRTIFMNENNVVTAYQGFLKILENKGAGSVATGFRLLLPIVKIPSNFVAETSSYLAGGLKAANVLRKGVENLTPEQKDYVLRNLKKQTLGATLLTIGYMNADKIGGYYQPGKKKKDDIHFGDVDFLGVKIPHVFLHAPALEMLQFGATIKRVQDKMLGKHKTAAEALEKGMGASTWGLAEQQPFIGEAARTTQDLKNGGTAYAVGDIAKGFLVPRLIQETAEFMDKDEMGEIQKRKPEGVLENLQTGIPILREQIKKKK